MSIDKYGYTGTQLLMGMIYEASDKKRQKEEAEKKERPKKLDTTQKPY